jgi:hypothetical protein
MEEQYTKQYTAIYAKRHFTLCHLAECRGAHLVTPMATTSLLSFSNAHDTKQHNNKTNATTIIIL